MKLFFKILFFAFGTMLYAQQIPNQLPNQTIDGKKEGNWVIWYNKKWKTTTIKDSVAFYRKITFKNDKPTGWVNDFYKSGKKQWEGKLLSIEPEINEGNCIWYYENGNKSSEVTYINGLKEGKEINYYESGKLKEIHLVVNGELNGKVTIFFEDGNTNLIGEYQNNKKTGKWIEYKKDGTVDSENNYSLPKINDKKTITIFDKLYNATFEEFKNIINTEKPNLNEKDEHQVTLLMYAVLYKDLDFVKLLVENGVNTNNDDNKGMLCLDDKCASYYGNLTGIAAAENKLALLSYLIEELKIAVDDKEYNYKTKQYGWTPLQWASYNGNIRIIKYLIDKGANINLQDADGNTPLILACLNKQKEAAELLITLKADTKINNKENKSFIDYQQNIVVYNYDFNPYQVTFDTNFEMFDKNCFDKNDLEKIKELFENKLIKVDEKEKIINIETLNQINQLFKKNISIKNWPYFKCLNLEKVPVNTYPGLYKGFTIPLEFMENSFTIIYFILNSRSMSDQGDAEKQSWFNLLPLMTDEQISKLYSILIRENNKLNLIENKYDEKKNEIKLKYLFKWIDAGLIKGQNSSFTIDSYYKLLINKLKSSNNTLTNLYNDEVFSNMPLYSNYNIISNVLKHKIITNSTTDSYSLNKLYDLVLTINQSSINKDKLLVINDEKYFNKTQELLSFEINNRDFMRTMIDYTSNSKRTSDKNSSFNKNEWCGNSEFTSKSIFDRMGVIQNEYFSDKIKDKNYFITSNKEKIETYTNLKKEVNALILDKLLLSKVSSIKYYTLDDIKNTLSNDEVAIEFMVLKDSKTKAEDYFALIQLPKEDIVKEIRLCSKNDLEAIYSNKLIFSSYNNSKLYSLIWKPIENIIKNYKTIYYTTDGFLNKINLALLKNNEKFLFQTINLKRLTSTSKLIEEKKENNKFDFSSIALFGGIDFKNIKNIKREVGIEFGDFGAIDGTKKEIDWISGAMTSTHKEPYINENANKNNFIKLQNSKPDILHIATHGFYIPKTEIDGTIDLEVIDCMGRYFIVAPTQFEDKSKFDNYIGAEIIEIKDQEGNIINFKSDSISDFYKKFSGKIGTELKVKVKTAMGKEEIITTNRIISENMQVVSNKNNKYSDSEDPMIRAGLALYGADETLKDNSIMTAYEISRMNLPSTQLVVLSACNTAIGDNVDSEGVYGLIRAFKMAGVKNLLITYWSIPDEETVKFMQYFYESIKEGNNPRTALNFARNEMIKSGYMISSWGAFDIIR